MKKFPKSWTRKERRRAKKLLAIGIHPKNILMMQRWIKLNKNYFYKKYSKWLYFSSPNPKYQFKGF